jgi:salicylate hydroxylase
MTARTAKEIGRVPLGEAAALRYAPYWIVRRADLQSALLARVTSHPDIDLRLGAQFEDVAVYPKGVTVVQRRVSERQQEPALALIGADGVWSSVRHQIFPDAQPQFTGSIAWRGTVDASQLPRGFMTQRVQLWMGTNAHLVAYPMSGGKRINMVAIVSGKWNRPGWSEPGDVVEIANHFADPHWPIAARMMIGAVDSWRKWALFAMRDGGVWNKGPIALLGDASHAMLPFAAQGAGMAIEDAAVIAKCLDASRTNPTEAFAKYASLRASRVGARSAHRAQERPDLSPRAGRSASRAIRSSACWADRASCRGRTGFTTGKPNAGGGRPVQREPKARRVRRCNCSAPSSHQ